MELSDYLKVGEVCEVQGKMVKAGVYSDKNTEYLNYNGSVIKNVGIGSFVLIRKGFNNIINSFILHKTSNVQKGRICLLGQPMFMWPMFKFDALGNYIYAIRMKAMLN